MKSRQSGVFQYIKMPSDNRRLFCLQQNISIFAWMLFFIKDSLTPIVRSDSRISRVSLFIKQMRSYLGLVKKNMRFLSLFIGYKLQLLESEVVLELPCYGQFCVPIHKGYKIFDLYRGVVNKVFDHDVNSSVIREEIELLTLVSCFEFSPSIQEWNLEEGWYEEDYVQGVLDSSYTPMDSATVRQKFSDEIVQPLSRIMLFQKPTCKNDLEYVLEITRNLPRQMATGGEYQRITSFIDSIVNRLQTGGNCPIFLVFAHGDFVPANMLNTQHGMKIIDWEGAGCRSALFDFYSYFFYRPACREVSVSVLGSEIQKALPMLISGLAEHAPEVSSSLKALEKNYRWTFYIEMICRLVDRQMTDTNLDVMHYIQEYIKAFNLYEELYAGGNA